MAKNSIRDYSATNSSNTDIQSIDISEGCSPAGINNAIREVMADLKDVSTGAVALESPSADSLTVTGDLTVDTNTLYVDSTNNRVGVGTTSPNANMQINSANGSACTLNMSQTAVTNFKWEIPASTDALTLVYGASTERLRIDSSGRLIINDTNPSGGDALTVYNYTIASAQYGIQVRGNAQSYTQYGMRFYDSYNTSMVGSITYNTTTVSYNTSSDYRLKTNVTYDWDATTRLKQLKPARFEWIADGDNAVPVDGFLAHEVQDIVPEAINGTKDAVDDEGNIVPQSIDQSKLVPLLVKTIQELEARITALEAN